MHHTTITDHPISRASDAERRARRSADLNEQLSRFSSLPDDARVRLPVVLALVGVSASTLWRRIAAGKFAAPVRDGRTTAFRVGDIRAALTVGAAS